MIDDIKKKVKQFRTWQAEQRFRRTLVRRDGWMTEKFGLAELSTDELREICEVWPFVKPNNDDLIWNRMYKSVHGFDPYFVSDYQVQPIYQALNPPTTVEFLKDKNMIEIYCPELAFPQTYVRCMGGLLYDTSGNVISKAQAARILEAAEQQAFIVKPSRDSGCGKGVQKTGGGKNCLEAMRAAGSNYVVQECLRQCDFLNRLNETSINTCRITSLYIDGHFSLSTILKVGKSGAVIDNWNSSYCLGIDKKGYLANTAYDDKLNEVTISDSGVKFEGLVYPDFPRLTNTIEIWHKKYFPTLGILGWDVFIDEREQIRVIEVNPDFPGVVGEQFCSGTFFREYRDVIVEKIFSNRNKYV